MPSSSQLLPQMIALMGVISLPVVFGYAGVKGGLGLWLAHRRKRGDEFWRLEKRWLLPVLLVNLCFAALFVYGWTWEPQWVSASM